MQFQSQLDLQLGTNNALLKAKTPQLEAKIASRPLNLEPKWLPRHQLGAKMTPKTSIGNKMSQTPSLRAKLAKKTTNLEPRWPPTLQLGAKI